MEHGELVRPEVVAKRERRLLHGSAAVDTIAWSYHDFGYGNSLAHVGRETVNALREAGVRVRIAPWGDKVAKDMTVPWATDEELARSAVVAMARTDVPGHVHARLRKAGAPFVAAYYMLEGTGARDADVDFLEGYDAVFVPSEFCRKVLAESGLSTPVRVWGHGFDHRMFPYVEPRPGRPFTFLWFGDENRRKGYDLFLRAFAALNRGDVRAWVRGPGSGGVSGLRKKYAADHRIVWDTQVSPPGQLKEMMAEADVLVAPFRGEGFGLTLLEAMASGRPVVCTRFSGPLDFGGGDDLTYWVGVAGWEAAQYDSGNQAVPDFDDLVAKMEWCADHPDEVRDRGRRAHAHAHASWTWLRKAAEVLPVLRDLIPRYEIPPVLGL